MKVRRHFVVSGRVQGVFFRQSSRQQAKLLELSGWVRNLPDGSVEIEAAGQADAMAEFEQWLSQGPENARVDSLNRLPPEDDALLFPFEVR